MYPFRLPRTPDAPRSTKSAAVAKRRLHETLPMDRVHNTARHDDSEGLLVRLLQEDLCSRERRSA